MGKKQGKPPCENFVNNIETLGLEPLDYKTWAETFKKKDKSKQPK